MKDVRVFVCGTHGEDGEDFLFFKEKQESTEFPVLRWLQEVTGNPNVSLVFCNLLQFNKGTPSRLPIPTIPSNSNLLQKQFLRTECRLDSL